MFRLPLHSKNITNEIQTEWNLQKICFKFKLIVFQALKMNS